MEQHTFGEWAAHGVLLMLACVVLAGEVFKLEISFWCFAKRPAALTTELVNSHSQRLPFRHLAEHRLSVLWRTLIYVHASR
jgi:hypothetical protein